MTQDKVITWAKGRTVAGGHSVGGWEHVTNYLCKNHALIAGIKVTTRKSLETEGKVFFAVITYRSDNELLQTLQQKTLLPIVMQRVSGANGVAVELEASIVIETDKTTTGQQGGGGKKAMVAMINVLHSVTPIPYWIKEELAESHALDKKQLGLDKLQMAARVAYDTTMLSFISRTKDAGFPPEVIEYIARKNLPTGIELSAGEISRALAYGVIKPGSLETLKQETKASFAEKILDEYQERNKSSSTQIA